MHFTDETDTPAEDLNPDEAKPIALPLVSSEFKVRLAMIASCGRDHGRANVTELLEGALFSWTSVIVS
jgi:hypothetical protein